MATMEELIFTNLKSQLTTDLTWAAHIEDETPFVAIGDIGHHVLPLVQFFWTGDSLQEQNNAYTITKAPFIVEIIDRSDYNREVSQFDLFQYRTDTLLSVKSILSLPGVSGFQQFSYLGRNYDVHMSPDFYIAQLSFQAWFQESYGQC
jgi:hypothetical protein